MKAIYTLKLASMTSLYKFFFLIITSFLLLFSGNSISQITQEDIVQIEALANEGDANSQYIIGVLKQREEYTGDNSETAVDWYLKAANQNHAEAQLALGMIYDVGSEEVRKSNSQAFRWYERAAENGLAHAQYNLGVMYDRGRSLDDRDFPLAAFWYEKSAIQGYVDAHLNLAHMYFTGQGVPKDRSIAYMWISIAADLRNDDYMRKTLLKLGERLEQEEIDKGLFLKERCIETDFTGCPRVDIGQDVES